MREENQKFKKGDIVQIVCLTEQLINIGIGDILPGDIVYIKGYDSNIDGRDYYFINKSFDDDYDYLIPINFLEKYE